MKARIILASALLLSMLITSCDPAGLTRKELYGTEDSLAPELKGLKVYTVSLKAGGYVRVAVLDNKVNSVTYRDGKIDRTTIVLNSACGARAINVGQIISENDSIIVARKIKQ